MLADFQDLLARHHTLVASYAAFLIAYLVGSISFAVVISKLLRLPDPRSYGSGNPGATNVLRSGSKVAAVLTLLLDCAKGLVPVLVMRRLAWEYDFEDTAIAFVGVAAVIGHMFPVFHRFRGGKGVATALGAMLGIEPLVGVGALIVWILIALVFRFASLASMLAAVLAVVMMFTFVDRPAASMAVVVMALLVVWRHARNIARLMRGTEPRFGDPPREEKKRRRRRVGRLHEDSGVNQFQQELADSRRAAGGKRRRDA